MFFQKPERRNAWLGAGGKYKRRTRLISAYAVRPEGRTPFTPYSAACGCVWPAGFKAGRGRVKPPAVTFLRFHILAYALAYLLKLAFTAFLASEFRIFILHAVISEPFCNAVPPAYFAAICAFNVFAYLP